MLLWLAPPANAVLPGAGADFGGGNPKLAQASDPELVSIKTARNARTLRLLAYLNPVDCGGETRIASSKDVAVSVDGSFKDSGPINNSAPQQQTGTYTIQGRFTDATHATGTARADFTQSDLNGRPETCSTGVVTWHVVSPRAGSGSGKLKRAASYYGHSAEQSAPGGIKQPFLMETSRTAKSLSVLATETATSCPGRPAFNEIAAGGFVLEFVSIKGGGFRGHVRLTETKRLNGQLYRVRFKLSFSGRFGQHQATGTWRTVADVYRKSGGAHLARCRGPMVSWTAAR